MKIARVFYGRRVCIRIRGIAELGAIMILRSAVLSVLRFAKKERRLVDGAKPVRQSAIRVVWLMASVYYALVLFRRCGLANGTKRASRTRQFEYGARKRARER